MVGIGLLVLRGRRRADSGRSRRPEAGRLVRRAWDLGFRGWLGQMRVRPAGTISLDQALTVSLPEPATWIAMAVLVVL
jgi:hypothetical protein